MKKKVQDVDNRPLEARDMPKPSEYIFAAVETDDSIKDKFVIFEKSHWVENEDIDLYSVAPDFLEENGFYFLEESLYEYEGTTDDGKEKLLSLGVSENNDVAKVFYDIRDGRKDDTMFAEEFDENDDD